MQLQKNHHIHTHTCTHAPIHLHMMRVHATSAQLMSNHTCNKSLNIQSLCRVSTIVIYITDQNELTKHADELSANNIWMELLYGLI